MAVNQLMSVGPMLPREPNAARERVSIGAPPQIPEIPLSYEKSSYRKKLRKVQVFSTFPYL